MPFPRTKPKRKKYDPDRAFTGKERTGQRIDREFRKEAEERLYRGKLKQVPRGKPSKPMTRKRLRSAKI